MKKVYVQIVDSSNGISQTGGIQEPVSSNKEIENALLYFGIKEREIIWECTSDYCKIGKLEGTSKIISIIVC